MEDSRTTKGNPPTRRTPLEPTTPSKTNRLSPYARPQISHEPKDPKSWTPPDPNSAPSKFTTENGKYIFAGKQIVVSTFPVTFGELVDAGAYTEGARNVIVKPRFPVYHVYDYVIWKGVVTEEEAGAMANRVLEEVRGRAEKRKSAREKRLREIDDLIKGRVRE